MKKVSLGESLHNMYVQLSVRDDAKAVKFVDELKPEKKMALSHYWKLSGQEELRQLFFKAANE